MFPTDRSRLLPAFLSVIENQISTSTDLITVISKVRAHELHEYPQAMIQAMQEETVIVPALVEELPDWMKMLLIAMAGAAPSSMADRLPHARGGLHPTRVLCKPSGWQSTLCHARDSRGKDRQVRASLDTFDVSCPRDAYLVPRI